jgi:hypothetical protein
MTDDESNIYLTGRRNYLLTNIADFAFVSTRTATVVVGDEISTITAILTRVLSTLIDIDIYLYSGSVVEFWRATIFYHNCQHMGSLCLLVKILLGP